MKIKKLGLAFWEIFNHTLLKVTLFIDVLAYLFSLASKSFSPPTEFYFALTVTAFLLSAIQIIISKNTKIKKLEANRPVVSLYISPADGIKRLRIQNLWDKPIKNINAAKIKAGFYKYIILLEGPNTLKPDETRSFIVDTQYGKGLNSLAMFEKAHATANFRTTITYEDFRGNRYKMKFNLGKNGIYSLSNPELITV